MIHVVAMKCLIGLRLLIHIELLRRSRSRRFKSREVGVGSFKIEESESELLCTDSTAPVGKVTRPGDGKRYSD
jgi:hypothetical protein